MAAVRILSRYFLNAHYKAKQPTYFVEQYLNSLNIDFRSDTYLKTLCTLNAKALEADKGFIDTLAAFVKSLHQVAPTALKSHTIRKGYHFNTGDMVSLRVWSGAPRRSPQIIITPDTEIKKIWKFDLTAYGYFLDDKEIKLDTLTKLARNDGLDVVDFKLWFNGDHFAGQVLCWDNRVEY